MKKVKKVFTMKVKLSRFRFKAVNGAVISIQAESGLDAIGRLSKVCNPLNIVGFTS